MDAAYNLLSRWVSKGDPVFFGTGVSVSHDIAIRLLRKGKTWSDDSDILEAIYSARWANHEMLPFMFFIVKLLLATHAVSRTDAALTPLYEIKPQEESESDPLPEKGLPPLPEVLMQRFSVVS